MNTSFSERRVQFARSVAERADELKGLNPVVIITIIRELADELSVKITEKKYPDFGLTIENRSWGLNRIWVGNPDTTPQDLVDGGLGEVEVCESGLLGEGFIFGESETNIEDAYLDGIEHMLRIVALLKR